LLGIHYFTAQEKWYYLS